LTKISVGFAKACLASRDAISISDDIEEVGKVKPSREKLIRRIRQSGAPAG